VYEINASTIIAASPEDVWRVLDDIPGWKSWMPETQNLRIDMLTPGPPRLGYRFRIRGKVVYANMEVTRFNRLERQIQFRLNLPPVGGTIRCLIIPHSKGICQLRREDRMFLPGPLIKFLDKTQRERFERIAHDFMHTIKDAIQQRAEHVNTRTPY
jgi:hypothetical protein